MLILAEREMIMKKVISLMLAVLMSLSVSGAVFADAEVSENMKNAILLAKDKLGIDDETYVMRTVLKRKTAAKKPIPSPGKAGANMTAAIYLWK